MSVQSLYPDKYRDLIDEETWAFIEDTNSWYPPDAADYTVGQQREIYDKMCRAFFAGYPPGVKVENKAIRVFPKGKVSTRSYLPDGKNLNLTPDASNPEAIVVYFHGGGFVVGGLESHDDVCAEICKRTGFAVVSIDYPLAPEHIFPADFEAASIGFEATALGGRYAKMPVVLVGDSAGGNLAAAVSHATREAPQRPAGQVLIYPGLDSDLTQGTFVEHADAPMLTTKDTTFYKTIRTGGDENLLRHKHCTPLNDTDFADLPPTVIVSAQCDPLSGDGRNYRDKILAAGGKAVWFNEDGLVHGFLRARHSVKRARDSFTRIVDAVSALGKGDWPY